MPALLLRPYLLSYKNRFLERAHHGASGEILGLFATAGFAGAVFWGTASFLQALRQAGFEDILAVRVLELVLLGFFVLLLFSNFVTALQSFYGAKDMPLLLSVPLSPWCLYWTRLVHAGFTASWMYFLFALPMCCSYYFAYHLRSDFLLATVVVSVLYLVIPAALGVILATLFVNFFPMARVVDFIGCVAVGAVVYVLVHGQGFAERLPVGQSNLMRLTRTLSMLEQASPWWLPPHWTTDVLAAYILGAPAYPWGAWSLLVSVSVIMLALGFVVFRLWFMRGWMLASESRHKVRITHGAIGSILARILVPFDVQLRSLVAKEVRMFLRDTAQSLQLLLILALTFIYLYNFRTLRLAVPEGTESAKWWLAVLTISNVAMGGCVAAAVATRFVFPSVSLEGRAYWLLRATPLSVTRFLYTKVFAWFFPLTAILMVLLLSGAMAVQAPPLALFVTAIVSIALGYGLAGIGVGIGAVYVRFDWESPAQITSSFGSLVYMLIGFMMILVTILSASYLYFASCVPALTQSGVSYVPTFCSFFLVFFVNFAGARTALGAGEEKLFDLER